MFKKQLGTYRYVHLGFNYRIPSYCSNNIVVSRVSLTMTFHSWTLYSVHLRSTVHALCHVAFSANIFAAFAPPRRYLFRCVPWALVVSHSSLANHRSPNITCGDESIWSQRGGRLIQLIFFELSTPRGKKMPGPSDSAGNYRDTGNAAANTHRRIQYFNPVYLEVPGATSMPWENWSRLFLRFAAASGLSLEN